MACHPLQVKLGIERNLARSPERSEKPREIAAWVVFEPQFPKSRYKSE
jgi:hypothetical protein